MYTLVFDTTGNGVALALYQDGKQLQKIEKTMEFGQAEVLAVAVKELLDTAKINFEDVDLLGVCTGPGSFTGVRAGLAFARGLALGSPKLKITGVSAFEVYAQMLEENSRAFYNAVVIETKREDFYFQLFDKNLNKLSEPMALTRESIVDKLKNRQTSFIGDGVERLLSVPTGLQIKWVELSTIMSAESLYNTVYAKYFSKNLDFPKPLYIREADACVK
jgi:tRNA threonylcarbamoyladenosine biosynthesis protein TsaB